MPVDNAIRSEQTIIRFIGTSPAIGGCGQH
jgi:hypothetical protein